MTSSAQHLGIKFNSVVLYFYRFKDSSVCKMLKEQYENLEPVKANTLLLHEYRLNLMKPLLDSSKVRFSEAILLY